MMAFALAQTENVLYRGELTNRVIYIVLRGVFQHV